MKYVKYVIIGVLVVVVGGLILNLFMPASSSLYDDYRMRNQSSKEGWSSRMAWDAGQNNLDKITGGSSGGSSSSGGNGYQGEHGTAYVGTPCPEEMTKEAYLVWLDEQNINEKRYNLIKAGLDMFHLAIYSNPAGHGNWRLDSLDGKGIECTGFIAYCYNKAGMDVLGAPASGGLAGKYTGIQESELMPGDIGANPGHHGTIYLGKTANGAKVFLDAGADPCPKVMKRSDQDVFIWLRHPDMFAIDEEYYKDN